LEQASIFEVVIGILARRIMSKLARKGAAAFGFPIPPIETSEPQNNNVVVSKNEDSKSEAQVCNFRLLPSTSRKLNALRIALLDYGAPRADASNSAVVTLLIEAATPDMLIKLYRASQVEAEQTQTLEAAQDSLHALELRCAALEAQAARVEALEQEAQALRQEAVAGGELREMLSSLQAQLAALSPHPL